MNLADDSVSVLLPAYNGEATIARAIDSILRQGMTKFEFVVVDDGSTDGTWDVIREFRDPRMISVRHERNLGLVAALTTGLQFCTGTLIARQDQDDVSLSGRLAEQLQFMTQHPDVVVVGTWANVVPTATFARKRSVAHLRHPVRDEDIRLLLTWNNPFVHGSTMMRRAALDAAGGYSQDEAVTPPEDYELWVRMAKQGKLQNIPLVLVEYHRSAGGMSETMSDEIASKARQVALGALRDVAGVTRSDSDTLVTRILNGDSVDATFFATLTVDRRLIRRAFGIRARTGRFPVRQLARGMRTGHEMHLSHIRTLFRKPKQGE